MDKIPFQDGTKISSAKVTIDGVDYPVTPARYTGATPLSSVVMNAMQTNIENAIDQNADNIGGQDYDSTATYEEGDIVKYEGQLYICIEAIDTPEEWDSTKWEETDVLSSAGGNEVAIGDSSVITSKTKIWINEEEGTDAYSEVVNSLSGNEIAKAPSVRAVNNLFIFENGTITNITGVNANVLISNITLRINKIGNIFILNGAFVYNSTGSGQRDVGVTFNTNLRPSKNLTFKYAVIQNYKSSNSDTYSDTTANDIELKTDGTVFVGTRGSYVGTSYQRLYIPPTPLFIE